MITPAFSTVACPDWTLDQIAPAAARWGYGAIELRTFGDGSRQFAGDPALTSSEKVRRLFSGAGVKIASLATSWAFDEKINPPVIGLAISDTEKSVRAAQRSIDLAASIECPIVRVFGFEISSAERRVSGMDRIAGRLFKVCDHANKTGVRVAIENGGSFSSAGELIQLIDRVNHPLLGACYNLALGASVGDDFAHAFAHLGDRLLSVRVKQLDAAGKPEALALTHNGHATPWAAGLGLLAQRGAKVPAIFEWDRAWMRGLAEAEQVVPGALQQMMQASARVRAGVPAGAH